MKARVRGPAAHKKAPTSTARAGASAKRWLNAAVGAAAPIFGSMLVLLSAIRPRIAQFPTPGTWPDAVFNGPAALLEASSFAAAEVLAADVVSLGGIAVTKYHRVGRSVSMLFAGLSVLAVLGPISVALAWRTASTT